MESRADARHTVTDHDTAIALGSGDVRVLGTPRMLAWLEAATVAAAAEHLADDQTSVGTRVELAHRRPSPVGSVVEVHARLTDAADGGLVFDVEAVDEEGRVLATGTVERAVVDRRRFAD